jgi:hypothetical protein
VIEEKKKTAVIGFRFRQKKEEARKWKAWKLHKIRLTDSGSI